MVVVVVRDEDHMNRWQIGEGKARIAHAPRTKVSEWARTLGINGIRKKVESRKLDEEGNVIDERQRNLALFEARR
jgi:hypothetical protein